ncbi:MAG TPA: hypothetical protein PJ984_04470, partial [Candidatus Saccharibacteria bacterium]|nr:hypothetical protein [Candidatus Saccharibacteria bacterium]
MVTSIRAFSRSSQILKNIRLSEALLSKHSVRHPGVSWNAVKELDKYLATREDNDWIPDLVGDDNKE